MKAMMFILFQYWRYTHACNRSFSKAINYY